MAEISIEEMKSLVNDGVVGASEFTEWISARACKFACDGDLAALSLALDEGADPNLADGDGNNPLIYAAKWGHEHCVARLLEAGADPNCVHSGRSVLHHAVLVSRAGAVAALLAGGASVVRTGIYKQHVLIVDALWALGRRSHRHGSGRIIPLLLRAGAVIPEGDHWLWRSYQVVSDPASARYSRSKTRRFEYLHAVQAAGGFPAYARAHRSIFVAIFSRGTRLPTDVLPTIVEYWAHLGWYQYRVPAAGAGAGLDDGLDDDNDDVLASSSDDESTTVP